jgi:hypothetical protein
MALKHIAEGWFNSFLDALNMLDPAKKIVAEARMNICATCPIREGFICSPNKLGINNKGENFYGCGCLIDKKTLCMDCSCPGGKW